MLTNILMWKKKKPPKTKFKINKCIPTASLLHLMLINPYHSIIAAVLYLGFKNICGNKWKNSMNQVHVVTMSSGIQNYIWCIL